MGTSLKLAQDTREAALLALVGAIDAGGAAGSLSTYTLGDTLLSEHTFSYPAFSGSVTHETSPERTWINSDPISADSSANETGDPSYFIVRDSSGNEVMRGDCGLGLGADAVLKFTPTSIYSGQVVAIHSFAVTVYWGLVA